MSIVPRLRELIVSDAFEKGVITSGQLAERLIAERRDAADEIERLTKLAKAQGERAISASAVADLAVAESDTLRSALAKLRHAAVLYMSSSLKPSLRAEADGQMIAALDLSRSALAD